VSDLRQEIALALNSNDDGCWSGEPCCWVSLDHAMPVVEAHLAAAWDEGHAACEWAGLDRDPHTNPYRAVSE